MTKKKRAPKRSPKPPSWVYLLEPQAGRPSMPEVMKGMADSMTENLSRLDQPFAKLLSESVTSQVEGGTFVERRRRASPAEVERLASTSLNDLRMGVAEKLAWIRHELAPLDPFGVLAWVSLINVFIPWGKYFDPTNPGAESTVELIAALLLTQPIRDRYDEPPPVDKVQAILAAAEELSTLAYVREFAESQATGADEREWLRLIARARWRTVRGDDYPHHAAQLADALYRGYETQLYSEFGFTMSQLVQCGDTIDRLLNERLRQLVRMTYQATLRTLTEAKQGISLESTELLSSLGEEAFRKLVWVQQLYSRVKDALCFTAQDILNTDDTLESKAVLAILEQLHTSVGSLPDHAYSTIYSENPLNRRPFVEWRSRYIIPVPMLLLREYPRIIEQDLVSKYPKRFTPYRAKVLDELALKYIKSMLPGSVGYRDLRYNSTSTGGEQVQVDGLVTFDRVLFIVEGKANTFSIQSQRGDIDRAATDMKRIVQGAWRQGARTRTDLATDRILSFIDERGSPQVTIEAGDFDRIFIVNPTLHRLGAYVGFLPWLRHLGLFPQGEYPWSVYINDLRIISETVKNPAELIYYLTWRSRLPLGDRLFALDELDLFGDYLWGADYEPHLREHPTAGFGVQGVGPDFDDYYLWEMGKGPRRPRPEKATLPMVRAFLDRLVRERPQDWLDAAIVCLALGTKQLAALEQFGRRAFQNLKRDKWRVEATEQCAFVALGSQVDWRDVFKTIDVSAEARNVVFLDRKKGRTAITFALNIARDDG